MATQLAGEDILASDIVTPKYVYKSIGQSVTSSTTPVNDTELAVPLAVGVWRVEAFLSVAGLASTVAGGITVNWATTGTITGLTRACLGPGWGAIAQTQSGLGADNFKSTTHGITTVVAFGGLGTATTIIKEDLLLNVTVAGTLTLQWAQRVSSATATSVSTGSRLMITQVEAA